MNLVEIYLKEIHNVKPYDSEWCKEFPDRKFVEVDATWDCYGRVERKIDILNTSMWEQIKAKGYFLG